MKIAIVAPLPQPFVVGGAEKLWWGLLEHLNTRTDHQADLVKLPAPEEDFWSLMRSYRAFSTLKLEGFDAVVVGKYPAWMVEHPNKILYMLHRLRGLYDAYDGAPHLAPALAADPDIAALRRFMQASGTSREALPDFFGMLFALQGAALAQAFVFPGPLSREIVHYLDAVALAPARVTRYAAISRALTRRAGYFPPGADVRVAHPPTNLRVDPGTQRKHFFTVSRLDAPKRIALVIEAMRHVKSNVPLVIAGIGVEEARLREAARGDARVRFAGFLSDVEIAAHYRDAIAVPFVPWQEDYGLVALEAMLAGKPVVTASDSGGVTELVEDGVTGFVCAPEAKALGAALDRLAGDDALAQRLGQAALARAAEVSWDHVARALFEGIDQRQRTSGERPKVAVLVTFPIHPVMHGGQSRAFHLYRGFTQRFDVHVVGIDDSGARATDATIAPGMRQVTVPKSAAHQEAEDAVAKSVNLPVTDIVMPEYHVKTPGIVEAIRAAIRGAHAVVLCHPYLLPALDAAGWKGPIWYEAQDVEAELKRSMLPDSAEAKPWLEWTRKVERDSLERSAHVLACSDEDAAALVRLYGIDRAKIAVVPNGTDLAAIRYAGAAMRRGIRGRMDAGDRRHALFIGSGHKPNIDAVVEIFAAAPSLPEVIFMVIGSVCHAFDPRAIPPNVMFMGKVDDATRGVLLDLAEIALNPVSYGSGTNLKMLDYFAAGIAVVSTASGARGLGVVDGEHFVLAPEGQLVPTIRRALALDAKALDAMTQRARHLVEERFDWQAIAAAALERVDPEEPAHDAG